ncbi:MAG: hypothetical protein GY701_09745 [Sulfitobacter sp.]|nr:hypothetical protein [Sulfitobacter sp.]MCP4073908.1 hypothetical protein [Hyphomicrobiales bacterium]
MLIRVLLTTLVAAVAFAATGCGSSSPGQVVTYREQLEVQVDNTSYDIVDKAAALEEIRQRTEPELKEFVRNACATASNHKEDAGRVDFLFQEYAASEDADVQLFQAYRVMWEAAVRTGCPDEL